MSTKDTKQGAERGRLTLDLGAREAVHRKGRSLLAIGVVGYANRL